LKILLHNTKGRKLQEFKPLVPGKVGMYCCGPTVYHYAHIGNLRTYVNEDFLRRTLDYAGYDVNHVVNITDVGHLTSDADDGDDKMEKGAAREGRTVWEIAEHYTQVFWSDWKKLNIREPKAWPRATGYIAEQIALVQSLEERGYAYRTQDGVYFDTVKFERYGEFAGIKADDLQAGSRIDMGGKKNPTDFALWKLSPTDKKRAMEWDSPWGVGFPGWHAECSAMSVALIGKTLDIHCGGTDHIRVHHTNEIAQSECAHDGQEFARYWYHGEFLKVDGDKMSKSSGEFLTLSLLEEKGFHALDYRWFCATAHYRKFLTFSWENVAQARDAHRAFRRRVKPLLEAHAASRSAELDGQELSKAASAWQKQFEDAVGNDINLPKVLGIAHSLLKAEDVTDAEKGRLILDWDRVIGIEIATELPEPPKREADDALKAWIEERLLARKAAREAKDWAGSDAIRLEMAEKDVLVRDTPEGQTWVLI